MSNQQYKPILFSTEMVKAILRGQKTMTRREVKGSFLTILNNDWPTGENVVSKGLFSPYGRPGNILWVRETFSPSSFTESGFIYKADDTPLCSGWKPGIHMPKQACRIFLEIVDVRVERLQNITEEDAEKEGVHKQFQPLFNEDRYKCYMFKNQCWRSAISSFQSLWSSINGVESWDKNPWVWVIEFKRIPKPENFIT